MIDYTQTVQTAAAALDRAYPGWPDDISLAELDMGNASYCPANGWPACRGCIAAQVGYHRYDEGATIGFDLVLHQLADLGGLTMGELSIAFGSGGDLEQAWRDYLKPIKTHAAELVA